MKTLCLPITVNRTWCKLAALTAGLGLLAGCVVMSVYPYYTVKDLTFDAGLAGRWAKPGTPNEFWEFTPVAGKSYFVTTTENSETNHFDGYLFLLKGTRFMDLCTTNRDDFRQLPLHMVLQLNRVDNDLKLAVLDYNWLEKLLKAKPSTLRHIVVPEKPLETNSGNMYYLTADTRDLQKFILKHRDNTNAFTPIGELKRVAQ